MNAIKETLNIDIEELFLSSIVVIVNKLIFYIYRNYTECKRTKHHFHFVLVMKTSHNSQSNKTHQVNNHISNLVMT